MSEGHEPKSFELPVNGGLALVQLGNTTEMFYALVRRGPAEGLGVIHSKHVRLEDAVAQSTYLQRGGTRADEVCIIGSSADWNLNAKVEAGPGMRFFDAFGIPCGSSEK